MKEWSELYNEVVGQISFESDSLALSQSSVTVEVDEAEADGELVSGAHERRTARHELKSSENQTLRRNSKQCGRCVLTATLHSFNMASHIC